MRLPPLTCGFVGLLALAIGGCSTGDVNGSGGGGGGDGSDLDPANPPDSPFDDNEFPTDGTCGDINVVVSGIKPTIQLLIDQSGSMDAGFGQGRDRWRAVYETLMGADGVVAKLETEVKFGLTLYTSFNGNESGACPVLAEVPADYNNFGAMDAVFGAAGPEDDTPTGASLLATANAMAGQPSEGPKIIILGTDGEPDTCAVPDPQTEPAKVESLQAADAAFDMGIRTYVVSVGDEVGADHLQDMANAGVGKAPGDPEPAPYYVALDADELINAFGTIVGGVTGCVFTIGGEVNATKGNQGKVSLDGDLLEQGTDWIMIDGKTFEILGEQCEKIQDGELHHVAAAFPCGEISVD